MRAALRRKAATMYWAVGAAFSPARESAQDLRHWLRGSGARAHKPARAARNENGTLIAHSAGMSKPIPTVQKYMTTSPHTIGADQTLAQAHAVLKQLKIRHLPVLKGSELLGMLTERDLALIETLRDVDAHKIQVEDAMSTAVYTVSPDAKLDEVVSEMAEKKYGSAVVVQNGKVVGILTTVDVCRALAELLRGRLVN
jgi:acetoin utilization protein AcuB